MLTSQITSFLFFPIFSLSVHHLNKPVHISEKDWQTYSSEKKNWNQKYNPHCNNSMKSKLSSSKTAHFFSISILCNKIIAKDSTCKCEILNAKKKTKKKWSGCLSIFSYELTVDITSIFLLLYFLSIFMISFCCTRTQ